MFCYTAVILTVILKDNKNWQTPLFKSFHLTVVDQWTHSFCPAIVG